MMTEQNLAVQKVGQLAIRLLERTRAGGVRWQATDRPDAFLFSGSQAAVVIRTRDDDGNYPFELALLDGNGNEVEKLFSHFDDPDEQPRYTATDYAQVLDDLWEAARAIALNIPALVDSLVTDIDRALG
jgi:hypothetical protein